MSNNKQDDNMDMSEHDESKNLKSSQGKNEIDFPKILKYKKDVISLKPGQKAKIEVVFKNTRIFMFHCHILEHEDNGMMGQIKVTK